eukprot:748523-Hanusia_phi.AAC.2
MPGHPVTLLLALALAMDDALSVRKVRWERERSTRRLRVSVFLPVSCRSASMCKVWKGQLQKSSCSLLARTGQNEYEIETGFPYQNLQGICQRLDDQPVQLTTGLSRHSNISTPLTVQLLFLRQSVGASDFLCRRLQCPKGVGAEEGTICSASPLREATCSSSSVTSEAAMIS